MMNDTKTTTDRCEKCESYHKPDSLITDAQLVIRELARRGFRFTYAMWL